jgi:hypothetical protein
MHEPFEIPKEQAISVGAAGLALGVVTLHMLVEECVLDRGDVDRIVHFALEHLRAQPDAQIRAGANVLDQIFTPKAIDRMFEVDSDE